MLAEFQETCECFSVLIKKDGAAVAVPEMKGEKTGATNK